MLPLLFAVANATCECPIGWVTWPNTCACVPCPGGFSCVGAPAPCPFNKYSPSGDAECHNCSACDNGTFALRPCGEYEDTACHRCMQGFYEVNGTCQVEGLIIDHRYGVGILMITVAEVFIAAWWWHWWRNHKAYSSVNVPMSDYDTKT